MAERANCSCVGVSWLIAAPPRILTVETPAGPIVVLGGEHDPATSDDVAAALAAHPNANVVIDLTTCTFVDTAIISVLVVHSNSQPLTIVAPPRTEPRRVFEMVGLPAPLRILDELPAIAADAPPMSSDSA